ncbi:MAG TPA: sulfotransferase [Solirubrobacterales bacterium]|nr:sulfotransferase [Solirubrobacterales bacterium]
MSRPELIFVGGTRFSRVDAVTALLVKRPAATGVPVAASFHSDPWGLPALLHGRIGLDDFADRLRAHEVTQRVPRARLEGALGALRASYQADPLESCRELFWALLDELVDAGHGALVDASPGNLVEAQTLLRLVPQARFVHVLRDGRDVAADAAEADLGAGRVPAALEWWAGELREIERGVRGEADGAPYAIPPEHLAVVVVDDLATAAAGAAYEHLLDRLPLGQDEPVQTPGSAMLDPSAIGVGRWRSKVRAPGRWRVARRYERTLGELEAEGNHAAPALRAAHERLG